MKRLVTIVLGLCLCIPLTAGAQNCCAPTVPQQGVMGETAALPNTLEIGLHYEYLRSRGMHDGSEEIDDPHDTKTDWHRTTLTASYGLFSGLSVSAVVPYTWKNKNRNIPAAGGYVENTSNGIGDITCMVRYSPLSRSFVTYRELTAGAGVKFPTGSTDERNYGCLLPLELQPGTGSWDYHLALSFYQGFEPVDFVVSGTYTLTGEYDGYEFGNQFSYLFSSVFHVRSGLDLSAALSGVVRARDREYGEEIYATGRHQLWLVPGVRFEAIPYTLNLQAYVEAAIYQDFNGSQLGSDYNLRLSAVYSLPLKDSDEDD